jgi:hypothetical protein
MNRIKDVSKIKLALGYVLVKIYMKQSLIMTPDLKDKGGPQVDYAEVVAVAKDQVDINVGDIVLDFRTTEGFKWQDDDYALVPRQGIKVATSRDNFDYGILRGKTKQLAN